MTLPATADVVVIGAGPVGLTTAIQLARAGVLPLVIERNAGPKAYSKALILHVRTQQVLDPLGVTDRLRSLAVPLRRVEVHAYGTPVGAWRLDGPDGPFGSPLILGQDRTERVLQERLAQLGVDVHWNTEAVAVTQDDLGVRVTVRTSDGTDHPDGGEGGVQVVRSRYVVGAEGSGSLVRRTFAFPGFEKGGRYEGEQFVQADARLSWGRPPGSSHLFLTDVGYAMAIEMPDGLTRIFVSLPDDGPPVDPDRDGQPDRAGSTLAEVQDALRRLAAPEAELSDAVWVQRYRTSHRRADTFRDRRAFIAGDAAHVHVPIGGQGMNTGLQDAVDLGWKLGAVVSGAARPALLDTYSAERQPVAAALLAGTDRAYRFVLRPGAVQKRLLPALFPRLIASERVQQTFRRVLEELNVAHPDSPLSAPTRPARRRERRGRPRAGEFAPDPALSSWPDRTTVRTGGLLHRPVWPLLLLTAGTAPTAGLEALAATLGACWPQLQPVLVRPDLPGPADGRGGPGVTVWLDQERHLHRAYRADAPLAVLVRPDGYLAALLPLDRSPGTARPADAPAPDHVLQEYLRRWLVPAAGR